MTFLKAQRLPSCVGTAGGSCRTRAHRPSLGSRPGIPGLQEKPPALSGIWAGWRAPVLRFLPLLPIVAECSPPPLRSFLSPASSGFTETETAVVKWKQSKGSRALCPDANPSLPLALGTTLSRSSLHLSFLAANGDHRHCPLPRDTQTSVATLSPHLPPPPFTWCLVSALH